ncbi:T9SS type A sorting domain-containing protein [Pontibacter beigongshangensis]|uniref:T9SS type A sorting domain-containing protein n=1 Tax=Pontibacter beigongshangensis TaxID=2574733 RepID=UPI0016505CF1|nr:T9SS type A sorting domain-containing protein [Pontibacter beigongshangensis]
MKQGLPSISRNKSLLLLLLYLCININRVQAQEQPRPYQSIFGEKSTEWNVMSGYCDAVGTMTLETSDTTVINDKEYVVVSGNSENPFSSRNEDFLREDTSTGRVWAYDERSNTELLLMDMTLEPGDKFMLYQWDLTPVEAIVSEVYYENNLKHIRFMQQDAWIVICAGLDVPLEFIEGIGPNTGFFHYQNFFQGIINSYVLCHFKDGERVYTGEKSGGACYITQTSITDDAKATAVEVYPNPAADDVRVTFNNSRQERVELVLLDVLSRPVQRLSGSGSEFQLRLQTEPSGVYFYRLRLNNRQIASGKIIKK